ncbi:hypothetical protein BDN71DRAFT_1435767 [Pleurotus eryngii]|uniref:Uncharacterized protein n=1 Tax=Pleurotus eryngii TaxID=5323 RepID=A0A9P5ZKU5_PLEER|nr:hypothetical protein BDN71DRAFT_1435767 [Pleurotus eryngii]
MFAIIAYDVSSQQAITATFTKLQQQLLAQYMFAKRASNRKFKQEIEAKWLITRTLSALKKKTDKLVREFFDNPHTKTACTIAKAAQELQKRQQSEGGRAGQSGMDSSRKKGERVAEAEDAMEGKGKATDMAASGVGKAMEEITVHKIVAPKRCATAKSKLMVGLETDEAGEAGLPVAGPSKPRQQPEPSSDEGEDEESDSGKQWNPHRQAKPRKGSMALLKMPLLLEGRHPIQREEVTPVPAEWQVFVQETNQQMDDMAQQIGDLGREVNRRLDSNSNKLESIDQGLKLVLDMLSRNSLADMEGSVEQRSEPAYQAGGSTYNRTLVGEWAQCHSITPIAPIVTEPAEPAPAASSSLPLPLPDMPPPPPAVSPPHTPPPAPHHTLSPSQGPTSPSTLPPRSLSPTHSPSLAHDLPTAPLPPELTPQGNTALANLSHALAQLQVPPPQMTRVRSATLIETLRRSTRSASRTPAPNDSKALK